MNNGLVERIDELLHLVDKIENETLPEDDIRWRRMLEIDAAIAVCGEKLPDVELKGNCLRIGFCRIPYMALLEGNVLFTGDGYLELGRPWRQMMGILKTQCSTPSGLELGPAKKRGPKGDPKKGDIERLYQQGVKSYYNIAESLELQAWKAPMRDPYRRVSVVINALQHRERRQKGS